MMMVAKGAAFLGLISAAQAVATEAEASNIKKVQFKMNPFCIPKYCINPLVPGLGQFGASVLEDYSRKSWNCSVAASSYKETGFCSQLTSGYHFAVPEPSATDPPVANQAEIVQRQAQLAVTTYVAHLSGMGKDYWDFQEPWNEDGCTQAIWKMACYLHFPRCNKAKPAEYLRPCASSCQSYLNSCGVKCCDGSAQCVFEHAEKLPNGGIVAQKGFANYNGPSPLCTGE